MKKGFWNYTEEIEYTVVLVKILPVEKPPMHWQNAFVGQERQAVKVSYKDYSFLIDNADGSGLKKIAARGGPDSYHASIEANEFIRDLPESEWQQFDKFKFDRYRFLSDAWQKEKYPEEYKKIQALKEGLAAHRKKYNL
jgi:hypothetical protein